MLKDDVTFLIPIFNLTNDKDRLSNFKFVIQKLQDLSVKILVVEQLHSDENEFLIKKYCEGRNVKYECIYENSGLINKSKLINYGTSLIETTFVWMNDADSYMEFEKILNDSFEEFDFIQPYKMAKKLSRQDSLCIKSETPVEVDFSYKYEDIGNGVYISQPFALSIIYKKSSYFDLGGFNETFKGWGYEDSDLYVRLMHSNFKFKLLKNYAIHLYHDIKYSDFNKINLRYYYNIHGEEKIKQAYSKYNFFYKEKTCNILTLFRGNFSLLENIDNYIFNENINYPFKLTWVINSIDEKFISEVKRRSNKYKDIRVITNKEFIKLSNHYYDHRHEYITEKYNSLFSEITDDYICTFEDDMVPQKNTFNLLYEKIIKDNNIGAVGAIYNSKDDNNLACCIFKECKDRIPTQLSIGLGYMEADRTGGGFTIWDNKKISNILPIIFTRYSENNVEGWDWFLSRKLRENNYKILINTDIESDHLTHIK